MDYLVSGLEMRELDRQTIEELGVPARTLMEVAGRAVAQAAQARLPARGRVTVACGPGNNGGDGFVAARALVEQGYQVEVFVFAERPRLKAEAKAAFATLEKASGAAILFVEDARSLVGYAASVARADLVIDALLGVGIAGEVRGLIADGISILNERRRTVISVDIPSGIDADTGAIWGRAVEATATVAFAFPKRGHYLYPGAEKCGQVTVVDIGIPRRLAERLGTVGRLIRPADLRTLVSPRSGDVHKGHFGSLTVVAGNPEMPGAALLAVHAACRSGAGLVRYATEPATLASIRSLPPEVTLLLRRDEDANAWAERILDRAQAVVVGPGWGASRERLAELTALLARAQVPLCLDADALNLLAVEPSLWSNVRAPLVITPHPKEMSRLIGQPVQNIQHDRIAAALQLAATRNVVVVLKGAGTIIAEPDGVVSVAEAGNPGLATAGTGDVLAGVIGGLLAQGLDPSSAARAGVLLHGAAGDLAAKLQGQAGLVASDVVLALGAVWASAQR